MAEYRQEWESEIKEIFLSDDLEEIVDRTRLFFREMKLGASQEQEKVWYWLACAYQHTEVSRTPFFPILFLYAVCENEGFTQEKITRYMGYAARYIHIKRENIQNNSQSKENELQNGWLERHMDQLPQEHQKVARIYLEIADYLFPEDEVESEAHRDNWEYNSSTKYWKREAHSDYIKSEKNGQDSGGTDDWQDTEEDDDDVSLDKRKRNQKKGSSRKGVLIGLIAGLLIGITLGCTGTALILNGYLEKDKQTDGSQTDISQSDISLSETPSSDTPSSDTSDLVSQEKTLPESSSNSLPSDGPSSDLSSDNSSNVPLESTPSTPSDVPSDSSAGRGEETGGNGDTGSDQNGKEMDESSGRTTDGEVF